LPNDNGLERHGIRTAQPMMNQPQHEIRRLNFDDAAAKGCL
jgi:hypothetical protein